MFKYIKWELKSLLKGYTKALMVIIGILALMLIIPLDFNAALTKTVLYAYLIMVFILLLGAFIFGPKKVVDTFRKPTFMLESMISFSPYKIVLAKYLLAFILNIICIFLSFVSILIIIWRASSFPNMIEVVLEILSISNIPELLDITFDLLILSIFFTSTVTCCFVAIKSWFPKMKGSLILCVVVWYIFMMILTSIVSDLKLSNLLLKLGAIALSALFYYLTVQLIENKLEVY